MNRYFANKRRVEPYILGSYIDKKFIVLDSASRKSVQLNFFPEKMKNMDNFEFQVSAFNYPPKVLIICILLKGTICTFRCPWRG